MKFRKRQLILASLVLALVTAVYLNWQFSGDKNLSATGILDSTKELGEAKYVNSSNVEEKSDGLSLTAAQVSDITKKYFAEAGASRQKNREEAEEKLKGLASTQNINDEVKNEIAKQLDSLTKNSQQETNIENLIKAKGFGECLVSIQNGESSVVVNPGTLNENTAVIIRDIVAGQTGIPYDKIKIIEAK